MTTTRRMFLKGLAAGAGLGALGAGAGVWGLGPRVPGLAAEASGLLAGKRPVQLGSHVLGASTSASAAPQTPNAKPQTPAPKSLVVIQLAGGNDGLATVLPYADPALKDNRTTLSFSDDQLIKLDGQMALHPNLKGLKPLWDQHKLAIVQGAGYPNPNRSHFASMDIWATASPDKPSQTGWLGRYLDAAQLPADNPFNAASVGSGLPFALRSQKAAAATVQDASSFTFRANPRHPDDQQALMAAFSQIYQRGPGGVPYYGIVEKMEATASLAATDLAKLSGQYRPAAGYPQTQLGKSLQTVAELLTGNFGTRIYYVQAGSYDTHANEKAVHDRLMSELGDGIAAFHQDISARGLAGSVVMMTWSEFGRRVKENASGGTDHGTAAPMFVVGDGVKGGLVGTQPSLTKLDANGDLVFDVDFRSVYNTLLTRWLGMDGQEVLGSKFDLLPLFS